MKHLAVSIDWYGPYLSIEEIRSVKMDYGEGLYMAIGREYRGKKDKLMYVGIGNEVAQRVGNKHITLDKITQNLQIWLGEVSSTGKPGTKDRFASATVDLAEAALAYGLQPTLNRKKTVAAPRSDITVFSRWWRKDYETPRYRRPHKDWFDVVDYRSCDKFIRCGNTKWEYWKIE